MEVEIHLVDGAEGERLARVQAQVIRDVLAWAAQKRSNPLTGAPHPPDDTPRPQSNTTNSDDPHGSHPGRNRTHAGISATATPVSNRQSRNHHQNDMLSSSVKTVGSSN